MATATSRSLSEQLIPVARTPRQRVPIVRAVSQVAVLLGQPDSRDPFIVAQREILTWMNKRTGRNLPREAWDGHSFQMEEIGSQHTEAISLGPSTYWAARLDDNDKVVPQRVWVTEIGLGKAPTGTVTLGARLLCVTGGDDPPFDPTIPGFVRNVVGAAGGVLDGRHFKKSIWLVDSEEEVDELATLLVNPARKRDAIVVALPEESRNVVDAAVDAVRLHKSTLGAAHVAVISGPSSRDLTSRIGKEFSVFHRAVRTYRPGFDPYADQPFRHPLALAEYIDHRAPGGALGFEKFLIAQALSQSVATADAQRLVPSFATVKRLASQVRLEQQRAAGAGDAELAALAMKENEELRKAAEEQRRLNDGLLAHAERERDQAIEAWDQSQADVRALRYRIEALEEALTNNTVATTVSIPATLELFEEWSQRNLAGAVVIHNRALQGVKKSLYRDVAVIYQALLLLRDKYVPMKRDGGLLRKSEFEAACRELGIEECPTFSGPRAGEEGDTYRVQYAGQRRELDRHLKKGNSRDPRYCFRLYFFWDAQNNQAVVGWLPSHLDNRLT